MPTDDDENTVTVEELDDMLTHDQKDELRALLLLVSVSDFSEQGMLSQFAMAKSFVCQMQS